MDKVFKFCLSLLILIMVAACEKDDNTGSVLPATKAENNFFYIEYSDPIRFRSYNRLSVDSNGVASSVSPQSNSKQFAVDVDQDGENDFYLNYSHYGLVFNASANSSNNANVEWYRFHDDYNAIPLDEGDIIEGDGNHFSFWGTSANLKYDYNQPTDFKFTVFRKGNRYGYIKWLYIDYHLRLKSIAFDKNETNKITTGQRSS